MENPASVIDRLPPEIRARVEATVLFEFVPRGKFSAAGLNQARLRALKCQIRKVHPQPARRRLAVAS
jgi:hypothetical protein